MATPRNIHSLTSLRRDTKGFLRKLKTSRLGMLLTLRGRGAAVLLDLGAYEQLLARAWKDKDAAAVQMGILEVDAGLTRPLEDAIRELRARWSRRARGKRGRSR